MTPWEPDGVSEVIGTVVDNLMVSAKDGRRRLRGDAR